jgi:hypothetical protein
MVRLAFTFIRRHIMGWLFTHGASKADIVRELTAPQENDIRRWETLAHSVRGNVLWSVVEITDKTVNRSSRVIVCNLLAREPHGWGYKDMDESVHPFYYSCPLKYLSLAPVANAEWREAVKAFHRNRNRRLAIGEKVAITGSTVPWVVITSLRPLVGEHAGQRYRVPRRMLGEVLGSSEASPACG